jgi:hypothetical protein
MLATRYVFRITDNWMHFFYPCMTWIDWDAC